MNFVQKTYSDSWLYNKSENDAKLYNRNLIEFISKADRIDKESEAFRDIIEDVKRHQTSSILYTILQRDDVVLCVNATPLPRAFKVFEAYDVRTDKSKKVFIDVTGLVVLKDNNFICKNIGHLTSYLFGALTYLLYRYEPIKLTNNSSITISGTECYVAMCNYIIDYLRIAGYSLSKNKICYLFGLFFLHNMLGKDLDAYTKNIAAKVAGVSAPEIRLFDIYLVGNEDIFDNINVFITFIANTFKLKGLTTEVFIGKWLYSYQTGTQFGVELFTSFSVIITHAYCGAYIVNQKQIERCCVQSMVKYATSLLKLGVEVFDNRGYMEASEFDKTVARNKETVQLAESLLARNKVPEEAKFDKTDCESKEVCQKRIKDMIKYYTSSKQEDKLSKKICEYLSCIIKHGSKNSSCENGCFEVVIKGGKKYILDSEKEKIASLIDKSAEKLSDEIAKAKEKGDKELANLCSKQVVELRKCKSYL